VHLGGVRDRLGPAVRRGAHRGHPLGNVIGPTAQSGDDFVELEGRAPEVLTGAVPAWLLARQRRRDQLRSSLLQMSGNSRGCRSHSILLTLRRGAALSPVSEPRPIVALLPGGIP